MGRPDDPTAEAKAAPVWAAMSHEIRTPLTGVIGMLEILGHTSLTEEQRRIIATAEASSLALMRIVDDVLDFAKLESSSVVFVPVPTDLALLVEDCAGFLANQAASKGLALTCECDHRIPPVICDPLRVRQLMVNLAGNAIKFTDRGEVVIALELTGHTASTAALRLSVTDSGIGIPAELRPFLFQPFSQIATAGRSNRQGSGLGLAICRRIVEIMGGAIAVADDTATGAVFHVDLVLPTAPDTAAAADVLADVLVLAAECGESAQRVALRYLEDAGAAITRLRNLGDAAGHLSVADDGRRKILVIGPDAEPEEIVAASDAISRTVTEMPGILWLRPRLAAGSHLLARRGIQAVSAYPVRRADILAAATRACGRVPPEAPVLTRRAGGQESAAGREEAAAVARAEGRVILVAEDNSINREVLRQQLMILGYDCDIAEDGAAALRALSERSYVLLLCDCHMPGIDGFELTRMIRAKERDGAARLPIVAVTANALPGEAARCRAAGMDDYLAKPIEIRALQSMLEQWLVTVGAPLGDLSGPAGRLHRSVVDIRNLAAVYGNDPARLAGVLSEWRTGIEAAVRTIRTSMATGRNDEAAAAAHRIKGSAGIAGAYSLASAATMLERALRGGDLPAAKPAAQRVEALASAAIAEIADRTRQPVVEPQAAVSAAGGSAGTR